MKFLFSLAFLVGCDRSVHTTETDTSPTDSDTAVDTDTDPVDTDVEPDWCENVLVFDDAADGVYENILTQRVVNGLNVRHTQVRYESGVTVVTDFSYDEFNRYTGAVDTNYACVDCDTSVETGVITSVYTLEYLDSENAVRETFESDLYPDRNSVYTYWLDEAGRTIRQESDWPMDGAVDQIVTYTYNVNGDMTSSTNESPDGLWDTQIHTWTFDEQFRRIRDEDFSQLTLWVYSPDGRIVTMAKEWKPLDGIMDSAEYGELDENGRWTYYEYDWDANGVIEDAYWQTYNSLGLVTLYQGDRDADGDIDGSEEYTYDSAGRMLTDAGDNNPYDGTVDGLTTWTYDEYGRLLIWESDGYATGVLDDIPDQRQTWTYGCPPL